MCIWTVYFKTFERRKRTIYIGSIEITWTNKLTHNRLVWLVREILCDKPLWGCRNRLHIWYNFSYRIVYDCFLIVLLNLPPCNWFKFLFPIVRLLKQKKKQEFKLLNILYTDWRCKVSRRIFSRQAQSQFLIQLESYFVLATVQIY